MRSAQHPRRGPTVTVGYEALTNSGIAKLIGIVHDARAAFPEPVDLRGPVSGKRIGKTMARQLCNAGGILRLLGPRHGTLVTSLPPHPGQARQEWIEAARADTERAIAGQ